MISSVGLEHYLDRVGVTGSNPVSPTMRKKIFLIPIITLGIIFIFLGLRWMLVDEPWMLDRVANEERLNMTFEKLFSEVEYSSKPTIEVVRNSINAKYFVGTHQITSLELKI